MDTDGHRLHRRLRRHQPQEPDSEYGKESGRLILAIDGDEASPVTLKLPDPASVDPLIATNWHTNAANAVPYAD
ncbi:hypothetical protein [Streptomyces sp. NPDC092952]|uniref:hypothetical protein n=1 Tax=Streptomyces sp. NPDC092952 TaxID=3366018 RepID=UPI00382B0BB3